MVPLAPTTLHPPSGYCRSALCWGGEAHLQIPAEGDRLQLSIGTLLAHRQYSILTLNLEITILDYPGFILFMSLIYGGMI